MQNKLFIIKAEDKTKIQVFFYFLTNDTCEIYNYEHDVINLTKITCHLFTQRHYTGGKTARAI